MWFPFKVCSYRLILIKKKRSFCIPSATRFLKFYNFAVSSVSSWRCFLCVCLFVLWWFWPMLLVSIVSTVLFVNGGKKFIKCPFFSSPRRKEWNQSNRSVSILQHFSKNVPLKFLSNYIIICSCITWFEIYFLFVFYSHVAKWLNNLTSKHVISKSLYWVNKKES